MHQQINAFSGTRFGRTIFEERVPFWRHLVDLGSHVGGPWISKGQSARCFSRFSAQSQKLKAHVSLYHVPLKLEGAKNEGHRQNEGPIHLAFLNVLVFHEAAKDMIPDDRVHQKHTRCAARGVLGRWSAFASAMGCTRFLFTRWIHCQFELIVERKINGEGGNH